VIKGGADCYRYDMGGLSFSVYAGISKQEQRRGDSTKMLSCTERCEIYYIFMNYEKWKGSMNAYDLMDVVNHVIKEVRMGFCKWTQRLHFLMVDEVQDLTPNILTLLMLMTERNIFFCGDTA
jgi:superfamily I DNA/RNA helicase